ncbi:MAG: GlsB/YeaQ/YmgE family stress response membrane protein [Candidatus Dojkabacteria bacterium]|nr:MAG: GlsB/YeaQ/YmgE family stress response membrane protein [Candidatus Dojkabacteria bacterium]
MNFIVWIIFGAIAGWIANTFVFKEQSGFLSNVVLGIAGSVTGGLLFEYFGGQGITGFNLYSMLVAVVGAIVLVGAINLIKGR